VAVTRAPLDGGHDQFDQAVVDEDAIAGRHIVAQLVVRDGDFPVVRRVFGHQHQRLTGREFARGVQVADADTRALQVAHDGHRATERIGHFTHDGDGPRMLFVCAVRKIDAGDIEPGFDQRANAIGGIAGWSQRSHNFGAGNVRALKRRLAGV
jgi:hypothetical protein